MRTELVTSASDKENDADGKSSSVKESNASVFGGNKVVYLALFILRLIEIVVVGVSILVFWLYGGIGGLFYSISEVKWRYLLFSFGSFLTAILLMKLFRRLLNDFKLLLKEESPNCETVTNRSLARIGAGYLLTLIKHLLVLWIVGVFYFSLYYLIQWIGKDFILPLWDNYGGSMRGFFH